MESVFLQGKTYKPIKFAYKTFKPVNETDDCLAPIIFLHGFTNVKENWQNIPRVIADGTRRQAYAYDARNHGDTEYSEIFSFDLNVDDLFHFMDTLSIEKAVLIGHSMGGITAIHAALKKPERIEMVVVEDMYVKKCTKEIANLVATFYQLKMKAVSTVPKHFGYTEAVHYAVNYFYDNICHLFSIDSKSVKDEWPNSFESLMTRNVNGEWDLKLNNKVLWQAVNNHSDLLSTPSGKFCGPAYFLYGSRSPFKVGNEEEHIKKHFPNAELIKFEDVSHEIHFQQHEKYVDTILQRLKHQ